MRRHVHVLAKGLQSRLTSQKKSQCAGGSVEIMCAPAWGLLVDLLLFPAILKSLKNLFCRNLELEGYQAQKAEMEDLASLLNLQNQEGRQR
jgi:hypothetical protein